MSLVRECLESFGMFGGSTSLLSDVSDYTLEDGAFLIGMETAAAINELYEMDYAMECDVVRGIANVKSLGVPVEEGIGSALSAIGEKLGGLWKKIKKFFADLRDKIVGWIKNAKAKLKEFFDKMKKSVTALKSDSLKMEIDGETVIITAENVKGLRSENAKLKEQRDSAEGRAQRYKADSKRYKSEAGNYRGQAAQYKRDADWYRAESDYNKNKADEANAGATALRTAFKCKVYKYTHLDDFRDKVESIYLDILGGGGVFNKIEINIEQAIKASKFDGKGITDTKAMKRQSKAAQKEASTIRANAAQIKAEILEVFGINNANDADEVNKAAFSYFRDGAKSENDQQGLPPNTTVEYIKKEWTRLGTLIDNMDGMADKIKSCFDDIIKKLDTWSKQIPQDNPNTKGTSELASALSEYSGAFSNAQSVINALFSAFINAVKEYQSSLSVVLKHADSLSL